VNKIIVVDDDYIELEIIDNALSSEGYRVIKLASGHSIVDICNAIRPFCILLDVVMPYKSGIEVYKELQNSYKTCDIPVIFITGSSELEEECARINKNINSFFEKPVKWDKLKTELHSKKDIDVEQIQLDRVQKELKEVINKLSSS
jgi:CheY-like chemotaxis protein